MRPEFPLPAAYEVKKIKEPTKAKNMIKKRISVQPLSSLKPFSGSMP